MGDNKNNKDKKVTLRIAETNPKFVGRGVALMDPKVMDDLHLSTGDVIEISGKKKTFVLLWSSQPSDHGTGLIRIDGYTRSNIGLGIDDKVTVGKVRKVTKAEQVIIAPTEELNVVGLEDYLPGLLEGRAVAKRDLIRINMMGRKIGFVVTNTSPLSSNNTAILLDANTEYIIGAVPEAGSKGGGVPRVTYEDIGGLKNEVQKVHEMIELPLRHPEIFERIGIEAPKGVLLFGPPGTGKTLLAKPAANETILFYRRTRENEQVLWESEERLRERFKQAQENSPSIIFIDEIDSIAPKREEVSGDVEKRVVSQLLILMDGIESRGKLVVIGAR